MEIMRNDIEFTIEIIVKFKHIGNRNIDEVREVIQNEAEDFKDLLMDLNESRSGAENDPLIEDVTYEVRDTTYEIKENS